MVGLCVGGNKEQTTNGAVKAAFRERGVGVDGQRAGCGSRTLVWGMG